MNVRRLLRHPLAAPTAVGLLLRTAWVLVATHTPDVPMSDSGRYLAIARAFARGHGQTLAGRPTAFAAPGYPMALTPFALLERVGLGNLATWASALNVLLGCLTIVATAVMARDWFGPRVEAPTAWLMAVGPGAIFLTSAAMSETLLTFVGVAILLLTVRLMDPDGAPGRRSRVLWAVGWGSLVGFAVVVRSNNLLFLATPFLVAWSRRWQVRSVGWRRSVAAAAGFAMVLVPWAVHNGTAVGVWSPLFTGGASSMCLAHRDGADGLEDFSQQALITCYRGSPMADPRLWESGVTPDGVRIPPDFTLDTVDEATWFRTTGRAAVAWAVRHPVEELRLNANKTLELLRDDRDALLVGQDFGAQRVVGPGPEQLLQFLADLWFWAVLGLAALGLLTSRACRRAVPLWAIPVLMLLISFGGVAQNRYHHPMLPFVVAIAAVPLATVRPRAVSRPRSASPRPAPRRLYGTTPAPPR